MEGLYLGGEGLIIFTCEALKNTDPNKVKGPSDIFTDFRKGKKFFVLLSNDYN